MVAADTPVQSIYFPPSGSYTASKLPSGIANNEELVPLSCTVGNFQVTVSNAMVDGKLVFDLVLAAPGTTNNNETGVVEQCSLSTKSDGATVACTSSSPASIPAGQGLFIYGYSPDVPTVNLTGAQIYASFTCN